MGMATCSRIHFHFSYELFVVAFFLLYIYDFSIRIQLWACMMTSLSCLNGAATDICAPKLQKHRNKKRKNTPKNEFTHQPNK